MPPHRVLVWVAFGRPGGGFQCPAPQARRISVRALGPNRLGWSGGLSLGGGCFSAWSAQPLSAASGRSQSYPSFQAKFPCPPLRVPPRISAQRKLALVVKRQAVPSRSGKSLPTASLHPPLPPPLRPLPSPPPRRARRNGLVQISRRRPPGRHPPATRSLTAEPPVLASGEAMTKQKAKKKKVVVERRKRPRPNDWAFEPRHRPPLNEWAYRGNFFRW